MTPPTSTEALATPMPAVPVASTPPKKSRGPNAKWLKSKDQRSYLLRPSYRTVCLDDISGLTEGDAHDYLAKVRWRHLGANKQACPACGTIAEHYWCESVKRWKCRDKLCGKQFSVLSGTRVHSTRMDLTRLLGLMLHFMEAKDSISSRELSGLYNLSHQTVHVLTLKMREALRDTMLAEPPLRGYIQADAAYFLKYVRPDNVGTGASLSARNDQKNAGLNGNGKVPATVNPHMHALVVFAQAGLKCQRRYKVAVVKTENQVDLLRLGQQFCEQSAMLITDEHSAYNFFSGEFDEHFRVNHNKEFMSAAGFHTNNAEGFFSRIRAAQGGAWHRLTLQYLELYGWEFAWRQEMAGRSNREQFEDLIWRVLNAGRSVRFADYWGKRDEPKPSLPAEDMGPALEVDKSGVKKKRGRPTTGSVRMLTPPKPKRRYTRRKKQDDEA